MRKKRQEKTTPTTLSSSAPMLIPRPNFVPSQLGHFGFFLCSFSLRPGTSQNVPEPAGTGLSSLTPHSPRCKVGATDIVHSWQSLDKINYLGCFSGVCEALACRLMAWCQVPCRWASPQHLTVSARSWWARLTWWFLQDSPAVWAVAALGFIAVKCLLPILRNEVKC